jgi:uncharacterized membrane protein (GlpM family)
MFSRYLLYFIIGGTVTAVIVALEQSNHRLLSGLAALVPIFTLVAYVFIGESRGGVAVGQHAALVLFGTLAAWVPYMLTVILMAPKVGPQKAVALALAVFFVTASGYLGLVGKYGWFQK